MKDCIFCKIVSGEIPSKVIFETEDILAFLDVNPRAPGHTLVIPKKHIQSLIDLEEDLIGSTFTTVKHVEHILSSALKPDAFTIGINEGQAAGQEIPHLHINVIPRFKNDGGGSVHSVVNNPPDNTISEIAEIILKNK